MKNVRAFIALMATGVIGVSVIGIVLVSKGHPYIGAAIAVLLIVCMSNGEISGKVR